MSFVSSKDLAKEKEKRRAARRDFLEAERLKYEGKQEALQRRKESGQDKWLLPSIEKRIEADSAQYGTDTKEKKHKKSKKKKKRKKKGSSESDESEEWQESTNTTDNIPPKQSENWLTFDAILGDGRTYLSADLKEKQNAAKLEKAKKDDLVGQHSRELNPYWKDGGKGLPEEQKSSEKKNKVHKDWLLRSLKRMNEQAQEQNKSIESIAAERYGSWAEFQRMLKEAEPDKSGSRSAGCKGKRTFAKPSDEDDDSHFSRKTSESFLRPQEDDAERRKYPDPSHKRDRHYEGSHKHGRSHRDHRPSWRKSSRDSVTERSKEQSPVERKYPDRQVGDLKSKEKLSPLSYAEKPLKCKVDKRTGSNVTNIADTSQPFATSITTNQEKNVVSVKADPANTISSSSKASLQALKILTDKEKNQISAKIIKAELMGNKKLAQTLKAKLDASKEAESAAKKGTESPKIRSKIESKTLRQHASTNSDDNSENTSDEETVLLTRSGKDGQSWPLQQSDLSYGSLPNKRRKKSKMPTHKDGERERYFADDDRYTLDDLVRRERTEEAEDQHAMFSRLASKQFRGTDSEYFTLDDMFVSRASDHNTRTEEEARQKQKAIADHKKLARRLESCRFCFGNKELPKHMLIAIGKKCYLMLPSHKPLSEGHCLIVPMHHCTTGTGLDEDIWYELKQFMRSLITMFRAKNMDCVFMQTCISLKKSHHFFIDCIPLPEEEGHMAPIYFKKAIQESDSEWSNNKKLVDTRGKDVQNCIPKGLPYFSVDFGMDGGFAHVVEDESLFPSYFGKEIIGGMLDVEPQLWRHPPQDHFSEQTKRSLKFSEWWKPYDCTSDLMGP